MIIKAEDARSVAKSNYSDAKQKQFEQVETKLQDAISNGEFKFFIFSDISLIKEDLEKLGYKVEKQDGEYNSTQYEVSFYREGE